jgi:WD40 repeat protein
LVAASSRDGTIKLWDLASHAQIASLQGHAAGIWIVNFSPDGQTLASGGMDAAVKIWNVSAKKEPDWFDGNTNLIWQALFDQPGNKLATWESETLDTPATALRLWDTQTGLHTALDVAKHSVVGFAHASDRARLVTWGTDSHIRIWNLHSNSVIASFKSPMAVVNGAAFSPAKNILFLWGTDASIRIVDAENGRAAGSLPAAEDPATGVSAVRISPDGKFAASAGYRERRVKLWDLASLREIALLPAHGLWITGLAFSPNSQSLAAGNQDSTITLWDVNSRRELALFQGHASRVTSLAFSPDNKTLATGSMDNTVRLWNCVTRNQVATLKGHPRGVSSVDFSPDGQTLATASGETRVRLWRASSFWETNGLLQGK